MSRFSRESLSLVLARDSTELRVLDRRAKAWEVRAQLPTGLADLGNGSLDPASDRMQESLIGLLGKHASAGAGLSTVIGDECARYFVVEPPANARNVSDLRLAAALRMEALYGDVVADWLIDADWSATRRFLACALPSSALAVVTASIRACKLYHAGVTTEFISNWRRNSRQMKDPHAWVAHVGKHAFVLAACTASSIAAVSTAAVRLPLSANDMMVEIERCALRWNLPAPKTVYLLGACAMDWPDQQVGMASLVRIAPTASSVLEGAVP